MGLTTEEENRVLNDARCRMPSRFQHTANPEKERLNQLESVLIELGFSPEKMAEIHSRQGKAILNQYVAEGTQRLLAQKANFAKFSQESLKIFMETFAPYTLGSLKLNWNEQITDELTGKKSPTMEALLKSSLPAISDEQALSDSNAYRNRISADYDNFALEYSFDRWELKDGKQKFPNERYFNLTIRLKVAKR